MRHPTFAALVPLVAALLATAIGCELITAVDRNLIPGGTGGGGTGGGGTGGAGCTAPSECPPPSGECAQAACTGGVCGTTPKPAGTMVSGQTTGDCKVKQCDGSGAVAEAADDADLPVDGNECTDDVCTGGVPSNPKKASGALCGVNKTLFCDGAGKCVGCLVAGDCGVDSECQHPTCTAGVCGVKNEPQGKALAAQTSGDCKVEQCDGSGGSEKVDDNADVPVDATTCTGNVCTAGAPENPPVPAATTCHESTGTLCNGAGACVACLLPADCPGADDECKKRTCTAGACGVSFTASGTQVASQTGGDCKKNVCDGAGSVIVANDDTDLPNDNNPCTDDTCSLGTPTFPFKALGFSCGTALVCDATGHCQGCNVAADCPGADDECKKRTCTAGTCVLSFTANGTAVTAQTPSDCKKDVCDGMGNVVSQNDDLDTPADEGNPCTGETCSAGVPGHPAKAINTLCPGGFCSAAATCVQCNAPAQCLGSDTDCHVRTCVGNTCGVSNTPVGTATSAQTPGDCKEDQCDGSGGVVTVNKDTDLPLDDGNPCTGEACANGTAGHPPKVVNSPCNQGNGAYCDGAGTCVGCTQNSQCASMVCAPATHTCAAPSCGDGVKNGTETDVDCGGTCSTKCASGQGCAAHADCATGACDPTSMTCSITCMDTQAPGSTCATYCACMTSTCPTKFASPAACLDACAVFDSAQLCCRAYHCVNAMSAPVTHCPHAAGEALCP
jgi:hypothetical protein